MDIDVLKQYLRIDYDDDDEFLYNLLSVAENYLSNAITNYELVSKNNAEIDLLKSAIVQELYDNRENEKEQRKFGFLIQNMITQLNAKGGKYDKYNK